LARSVQAFEQESDSSLAARVARQDEAALAALYDRHSTALYSLLRRILRDESACEEVLQDVFLYLWRNAARFDQERGELRGWLLVMARNRAISHMRKRTLGEPDDVELYAVSTDARQDTVVVQNDLVARVRGVMSQLPGEQCSLFEMAYFEGMTHSEIAERTGQPLGTVKTRLRTALTSLRRAFE
jgi:RNA polymerase sigma-70 factor, ECF subfamily